MIRLAVFDVDGTLVDSAELITGAMERACVACNLPFVGARAMLRTVGLPLVRSIPALYPHASASEHRELIAAYAQAYRALRQAPDSPETLFPDVRKGLERLQQAGILLAVATGKSAKGLAATLKTHHVAHFFASVHTSDEGPGKPHPHMLQAAMAAARSGPSETVMVGDTTYDIEMAVNAGCRAVGVSWGHHAPQELEDAGAEAVAASFSKLTAWILDEQGAASRFMGEQRSL